MSNFFQPNNPLYQRGVIIISVIGCVAVGFNVVVADFGGQNHIFTPLQKSIFPIIDNYFGITKEEILQGRKLRLEGKLPLIHEQIPETGIETVKYVRGKPVTTTKIPEKEKSTK